MPALAPTRTTSIVIADDHPVMRSGLRMMLESEPGFEIVAEAGTIDETFETVREHEPDVLLLDIYMPGGPALKSIPELREASPSTRIVVLTMQTSPGFVREALRLGATGYVTKQAADAELIRAVHGAAADEPYVEPTLGAELAISAADPGPPGNLTSREAEVLRLIALGYTNAEIAESLERSVRTVESHRTRLHAKLGLDTRADLVHYALEHGLIDARTG